MGKQDIDTLEDFYKASFAMQNTIFETHCTLWRNNELFV